MSAFISQEFRIRLADGTEHTVKTNTYDIYRAEKALGKLKFLNGEVSFGESLHFAHSAARRAGIAGDDFEAWLSEVDVAFANEEDENEETEAKAKAPKGRGQRQTSSRSSSTRKSAPTSS